MGNVIFRFVNNKYTRTPSLALAHAHARTHAHSHTHIHIFILFPYRPRAANQLVLPDVLVLEFGEGGVAKRKASRLFRTNTMHQNCTN